MLSKFMPYTPASIVGTAAIATHAEIFRMSSFCWMPCWDRCAERMSESSRT